MSPCRTDHILPTKNGPWRVVSEGSTHKWATSLLIVRTGRIVTPLNGSSAGYSDIPAYSQVLLRQRVCHLRTVPPVTTQKTTFILGGPLISGGLSWSPMRADYIIPPSVWRG